MKFVDIILFSLFIISVPGFCFAYEDKTYLCYEDSGNLAPSQKKKIRTLAESIEETDIHKIFLKVDCLSTADDTQTALKVLDRFSARNPNAQMLHEKRAELHLKRGSYESAIKDCRYSIEKDLGTDLCNYTIGQAMLALRKFEMAEKYFLQGLESMGVKIGSKPERLGDFRLSDDEVKYYLGLLDILKNRTEDDGFNSEKTNRILEIILKGLERNNISVTLYDEVIEFLRLSGNVHLEKELKNKYCPNFFHANSQYCLP